MFISYKDPVLIDLVDYTTLVGFKTITALYEENEIDTVYVRYANEDEDRRYDCAKPSHMEQLEYIISNRDENIIGWRLHHHHWEKKNLAAVKALLQHDEEIENKEGKYILYYK